MTRGLPLSFGAAFFGAAVCAALTGCGYVGDTLPPALRRPAPVTDLAAVQRGSKIILQFTLPKITTEGLPLTGAEDIELRIGAVEAAFEPIAWQASSDRIAVTRNAGAAGAEADALKYAGRTVVAGVRLNGPKGRQAGWSNLLAFPVVKPLPAPASLKAENAPDSVRITWQATAPEFRVFRRVAGTEPWLYQGNSTENGFTDPAIDYGARYEYFVQSVQQVDQNRYAESDLSATLAFEPADRYPPFIPVGLSAATGPRSIELVWDRNSDKDFAFYRLYRDGKLLADNLTAASFSDTAAEAGKDYAYRVSAVDTAGNESGQSPEVHAAIAALN